MIQYAIHQPGRWDIRLRIDTPDFVRNKIIERGHIIFTEEWVDERRFEQATLPTDPTSLFALSIYTGRVLSIGGGQATDTEMKLGGDHITGWLGDANGRGRILTSKREYTNTPWSTFVADIVGNPSNPKLLEIGTVTNGPDNVNGEYFGVTPKTALDHAAVMCKAEYRVNNNGTIDSGRVDQLYRTEDNPRCLVVRKTVGFDLSDTAFRTRPSLNMDSQVDAADWVGELYLMSSGDFAGGDQDVIIGSANLGDLLRINDYRTLFGDADPTGIVVADPQTKVDEANAKAQELLTAQSEINRTVTLDLNEFDISDDFEVGDTVWVYDPPRLIDADNWVRYGGEYIQPTTLRITEASWSIKDGMGVYYRHRSGETTDLSPYMIWEVQGVGSGGAAPGVGARMRPPQLPGPEMRPRKPRPPGPEFPKRRFQP